MIDHPACAAAVVLAIATMPSFGAGPELSEPGAYEAGVIDVSVPRTGGGSFAASLYYPATAPGTGAPFDPSGGPYAAVSFGHGFLQAVGQYDSTLRHLATWGYFAIAAQSHGGLFPNHAQFATDLRDCLTWLEARNIDPESPFHQQVDVDAFGLSGHSMGGGASILAAAADARVRALANLAPAETNPSAIAAMANVLAPARLINGSDDTIVPVEAHGQPMYDNGSAPRQFLIIEGGFHCGFTDAPFPFCDSGGISRAEQLAITRHELTSFFNLCLKHDQSLWNIVWGPEAGGESVTIELDAGVDLTPAILGLESPPGDAVGTVTVTNTNDAAASFTILIEDAAWPAHADPAATGELAPGEMREIVITVTVPADGSQGDAFFVTVRNDGDDATRGFARVEAHRLLVGDIDGNRRVDFADLLLLLDAWGDCPPDEECPADLDGDCQVGFADLVQLLANWG